MKSVEDVAKMAEMAKWRANDGEVYDAIYLPHPPEGEEPYTSRFDHDKLDSTLLAAIAPNRKFMDIGGFQDESGEYILLENE